MNPLYNMQFHPLKFKNKPESNFGPDKVETAGYQSPKQKIENMILAGQRLQQARNFDFMEDQEIDEDFTDPTRSPNFDMADAFQLQQSLVRSFNVRQRKIKEGELKSSQAVIEGSGEVQKNQLE